MKKYKRFGVQSVDEDIVHEFDTLIEALEYVREYLSEGYDGYQAVELDEDGGVQALIW